MLISSRCYLLYGNPDLVDDSDRTRCPSQAPKLIEGLCYVDIGRLPTPVPIYANCTEARNAGRSDIPFGDLAYGTHLDGDSDGLACEDNE